jgi:HAD superfamily hydrolase (TIGR01549 family)
MSKHKRRNSRAVLFDLDGTLVDTVYQHVLAWREALQREGVAYPNWKIHRHVGMGGDLFSRVLLREAGVKSTQKKVNRLQESKKRSYKKLAPRTQLLAGARELLARLSQLDVPWAIATSGAKTEIKPLLKLLKLPAHALVVTGDDVEEAKPEPDVFLVAAERLSVRMDDCIVIGDSVWDLLAAVRAKALGVGLLCGGYGQSELEQAGAYRVYNDPSDLLEHLEELGIR